MCTDFEFCVPDFEFWTGKKLDLGEDLPRSPSTSYIIHRPDDLFFALQFIFCVFNRYREKNLKLCVFNRGHKITPSARKNWK